MWDMAALLHLLPVTQRPGKSLRRTSRRRLMFLSLGASRSFPFMAAKFGAALQGSLGTFNFHLERSFAITQPGCALLYKNSKYKNLIHIFITFHMLSKGNRLVKNFLIVFNFERFFLSPWEMTHWVRYPLEERTTPHE
jgi:hypothetical protein